MGFIFGDEIGGIIQAMNMVFYQLTMLYDVEVNGAALQCTKIGLHYNVGTVVI